MQFCRSGADAGNSRTKIRISPRSKMSDTANNDDKSDECTRPEALDAGVASRVGTNEHLSASNDITAAKCEGPTSNFDVWWSEPENEDPILPTQGTGQILGSGL